jgi:hypothetical protein
VAGRYLRRALPERIDQLLAVDRKVQRLPHPLVGQDLVLPVVGEDMDVREHDGAHVDVLVGADNAHLIGRDIGDQVVIAGDKAGDARRQLRHAPEGDAFSGRLAHEIVVEGFQHRGLGSRMRDDAVGAGRHRLARIGLEAHRLIGALVDDPGTPGGQTLLQQHVGDPGAEAHRVAVDRLDAGEDAEIGFAAGDLGLVAPEAAVAEGVGDVLRGQLVAIVELDALAQRDDQFLRRDALPLGRQMRLELRAAAISRAQEVAPDQRVEDRVGDARSDIGELARRLQRRRQIGDRDSEVRARLAGRESLRSGEQRGSGGGSLKETAAGNLDHGISRIDVGGAAGPTRRAIALPCLSQTTGP